MNYILDTCTIIWTISEPEKIPANAQKALTDRFSLIHISPISAAEIACAVQRKKIVIKEHWKTWLNRYIEMNNWNSISITLQIMEEAYSLPEPFHRDPADRLIVASARSLSYAVITADKNILSYPHVESLWK